jgi:hypothetical protein
MRRRRALGLGSRMEGLSGVAVSGATNGQAFGSFKNLLTVVREHAEPKLLEHMYPIRNAHIYCASPFASDGRCA